MTNYSAPDLTRHPPRSPRVRLGGFVHLPRLLDKARAKAHGNLGEYVFPCALDKRFLSFTGIDPEALLAEVGAGRTDTQMLAWVMARMAPVRAAWEIETWSRWMEGNGPGDVQRHTQFADALTALAPERDDVRTTFDRLDLDDYSTFGGRG